MNMQALKNLSKTVEIKKYKSRRERGCNVIVIQKNNVTTFQSLEEASKVINSTSKRNYLQNKFYFTKKHFNKDILHFKTSEIGECFVMRERVYNHIKKIL